MRMYALICALLLSIAAGTILTGQGASGRRTSVRAPVTRTAAGAERPSPSPTERPSPAPQPVGRETVGRLSLPARGRTLHPVADARISRADADANHGTEQELWVGDEPESSSLVRFDLRGIDRSRVRTAVLRLWVTDPTKSSVLVYGDVPSAWAEESVTWDTRPKLFQRSREGLVRGWNEIDVLPLLRNNDSDSFDLRLVADEREKADEVRFHSREGRRKPELRLDAPSREAAAPVDSNRRASPTAREGGETPRPNRPARPADIPAHPARPVVVRLAPLPPLTPCTYAVPAGGAASQAAFDAALDKVQPGQTICLAPGVHDRTATAYTRRSGTAARPITIRSQDARRPATLKGWSRRGGARLFQLNHDWHVVRDLGFTYADSLFWMQSASHNKVLNNRIADAGGECARTVNQSRHNLVQGNIVGPCGVDAFGAMTYDSDGDLESTNKNGEGWYNGRAPEQLRKNTGDPDSLVSPEVSCYDEGVTCVLDQSSHNTYRGNTFDTRAAEAIDVKEGSEHVLVEGNMSLSSRDAKGAAFSARGDNNIFRGNVSKNSAGAGFRAGGDNIADRSDGERCFDVPARTFGYGNLFEGNRSIGSGRSDYAREPDGEYPEGDGYEVYSPRPPATAPPYNTILGNNTARDLGRGGSLVGLLEPPSADCAPEK